MHVFLTLKFFNGFMKFYVFMLKEYIVEHYEDIGEKQKLIRSLSALEIYIKLFFGSYGKKGYSRNSSKDINVFDRLF